MRLDIKVDDNLQLLFKRRITFGSFYIPLTCFSDLVFCYSVSSLLDQSE